MLVVILANPEINKQLRSCSQEHAVRSCCWAQDSVGRGSGVREVAITVSLNGRQTDKLVQITLLLWGLFHCLAFVLRRSGSAFARLFADGHHCAGGGRRTEV